MIPQYEMPKIDPVEAALAVIGIKAVISREVEKVKLSDVKEMHDLNKRVFIEARKIVDGETSSVPLGALNYKKTLNELYEGFNVGQLEQMVAAFPTALHDIAGDFLIKAKQTVELMKSLCPVQTKQTLLGPEQLLPPELAVRRFATGLDVVDDPMHVLAHIACGSLLKSQVALVKEVFPTFSACVDAAFKEAGETRKAQKKSFRLPTKVEIGYGIWKGLPRVSASLHSTLQANFTKAQAEKPQPGAEQQSGGQASVAAKEAMSSTQRGLYPNSPTATKAG